MNFVRSWYNSTSYKHLHLQNMLNNVILTKSKITNNKINFSSAYAPLSKCK
jgi:hypothetical protein